MNDEREGLPSCSGFDAEFRCLGRRKICEGMPDEKSAAAKRGENIHAVLEGKKSIDELCESDRITAGLCMHHEAELVERWGYEGARVIREERLFFHDKNMEPVASGKLDCIHLQDGRALIIDYKTGFSHTVPIGINWQIRGQAALVSEHYGVSVVDAVLIHPHHPESQYETISFKSDFLKKVSIDIFGFLEAQKNGTRTPNNISCQYCPAKNVCPEFQKQIEEIKQLKEKGSKISDVINGLSPGEREEKLNQAKATIKACEEIEDSCKMLLEKDLNSVTGWGLQKSSSVSIRDQTGAKLAVRENLDSESAERVLEVNRKLLHEELAKKGMSKATAEFEGDKILGLCLSKKSVNKLVRTKK